MGMGINIEVVERGEVAEQVDVVCSKCGSKLKLTRLKSWAEGMPTGIGGSYPTNTEQHCPVCGAVACEEDRPKEKVKEKQRSNFFSFFGG